MEKNLPRNLWFERAAWVMRLKGNRLRYDFIFTARFFLAFFLITWIFDSRAYALSDGLSVKRGLLIMRLKDNAILKQQNPDMLLSPASLTKMVTGAAALESFGSQHTFKTKFYIRGYRRAHRIIGSLVVVGGGDPYLVSEKLWQWSADIRNLGIREVTGGIIIDNSLFDGESRDSSRKSKTHRSRNAYDAPITALGLNFNTLAVAVAGEGGLGRKALVRFDPYQFSGISLVNKTRLVRGEASYRVSIERKSSEFGDQLYVSGKVPLGMPLRKIYRSVGDPIKSSGEILRGFLKGSQVLVTGSVASGVRKPTDKFLMEIEGYPMSRIVRGMNKYSNNYIADVLVKQLSIKMKNQERGRLDAGTEALNSYLVKRSSKSSGIVIRNGSGLDYRNRMSARQVVDLLRYIYKKDQIFPEFMASLPIAGLDGTLTNRFKSERSAGVVGKIRAKSGTLTEPIAVSSLAGYYYQDKHGWLAFAIIDNGVRGQKNAGVLQLRQDQEVELSSLFSTEKSSM